MRPPLLLPTLLALTAAHAAGETNDRMYPPAPAAKATIDIDGRGFTIHGRRTYLASGSLHYARVPHELWRDRLLRLQRAGFSGVETYAFWNFHEPRENAWDFTGDRDLGAFLSTAQGLGLYATVRPGPYVCAEWDSGGWPVWLRFKGPARLRTDDPAYLALNDHWYDKILPLIAQHQIHRGGNVVLVQLENEHPQGWGVVDAPYFQHLEAKAEAAGIEVPHFMSGVHHGNRPVPDNPDTSQRTTPWYSTEFWPGWFDLYGLLASGRLREVEHDNWSILARGGAGHNFYMLHGGTNFDTWNDPSGAASYDYGAAIGQAGDLRPIYFRMKRANQVAASFGDILADGSDVAGEYKDLVSGAQVLGARRSAAGSLVFLHNPSPTEAVADFKDGRSITMEPSEHFALPRDAVLAPGLRMVDSTARVLAVARDGDTVTVVTYGKPGDMGQMAFAGDRPLRVLTPSKRMPCDLHDPLRPYVTVIYPGDAPDSCTLGDGRYRLRVVSLPSSLSLYTWLLGPAGKQAVVVGPQFVADFAETVGAVSSLLIERPYGAPSCGQVAVFGQGEPQHLAAGGNPSLDAAPPPALGRWLMAAAPEASPDYDASRWKQSEDPLQMGADGDTSAFAWYRASFAAATAGTGTLRFDGADHVAVFVNGRLAAASQHHGSRWEVEVPVLAGLNRLAVFTSHAGRDKAFNYLGTLPDYHPKGLFSPVTLTLDGRDVAVKNWGLRGGVEPAALDRAPVAAAGDTRGVPALFRTSFRADQPAEVGAHPVYRLTYAGLSRGTMWLNGHNLGRYPEKIRAPGLYLPEPWLRAGENTVTVFDEDGHAPTKVQLIIETAASREVIRVNQPCDPATPVVVPTVDPAKEIARANAGNLAFRRPATASSFETNHPPQAATDGDETTRWCADNSHPGQWWQVDLGASLAVTTCEIVWERRARSYQFVLEGSADGQTWTRLGDHTTAVAQSPDSPSSLSHLDFSGCSARYVRVTVTGGTSDQQWASLNELRLLNTH